MATVGNLFVNIRGKTQDLEKSFKRSNKRITKDFFRDQQRAMENLRKARERLGALNMASPERFEAARGKLQVAEQRQKIAEARPGRIELQRQAYFNRKQRKEDLQTARWSTDYEIAKRKYLLDEERKANRFERMKVRDQAWRNRKKRQEDEENALRTARWSTDYEIYKRKRLAHEEHANRRLDRRRQADLLRKQARRNIFGRRGIAMEAFRSSPLAQVTTVLGILGLTISAFKTFVGEARRGAQLTSQFKFAGPMGGQIAGVEAGKVMQRLRMAQDPSVSSAKLMLARTELERERTAMESSVLSDTVEGMYNLAVVGVQNLVYGGMGYGMYKNIQSALRVTGLIGQAP